MLTSCKDRKQYLYAYNTHHTQRHGCHTQQHVVSLTAVNHTSRVSSTCCCWHVNNFDSRKQQLPLTLALSGHTKITLYNFVKAGKILTVKDKDPTELSYSW